jgi:hypothetical protein
LGIQSGDPEPVVIGGLWLKTVWIVLGKRTLSMGILAVPGKSNGLPAFLGEGARFKMP